MKNKIQITASLMLALPLFAGQSAPAGVAQQVLSAANAPAASSVVSALTGAAATNASGTAVSAPAANASTPAALTGVPAGQTAVAATTAANNTTVPSTGAVVSALTGTPATNASGTTVPAPAANASTPATVSGAQAAQTAVAATTAANGTTVPSTSAPAASGTIEQSVDKKFLVSVDVVQKALDDATAFVPIIRIDGVDRAVCFAGAKGAENVGYFMPGEAFSDPATTCVSMVPSTKSVQKVVDLSVINGLVSTTPIQWGSLTETKPDQIWFMRQQVGVCSTRGADGKVSGVGSFDLADQSKSCYLNDRVASLNDPDIVVMLK